MPCWQNATRICEAKFGVLFSVETRRFRVVALHNAAAALAEFVKARSVFAEYAEHAARSRRCDQSRSSTSPMSR